MDSTRKSCCLNGGKSSNKATGANQQPQPQQQQQQQQRDERVAPSKSDAAARQCGGTGPLPASGEISKPANEFAVDLFQCYLRRHGDKYINLLLCPYLIYHSLAMMLVGARGNTAQQLASLLRLKPGQQTEAGATGRHKEFLMLTEQLIHGNHDFVHLASFIYLDKTIKRAEQFKEILRDYYETKPKKIDFGDVDLTVKTINEDVARTTENIYNDILSKLEAAKLEKSMLSVNAVFFRGFWLSNFTEVFKAPFERSSHKDLRTPTSTPPPSPASASASASNVAQKSSGRAASCMGTSIRQTQQAGAGQERESLQTVEMMSKLDYMAVLADEQLDARVINMPFEASDLQMLLILPNQRQSNAAYLCEKISAQNVEQVFNELTRAKARSLRVTMPIFCVDSGKISIQSTLVTMGASDLFDKTRANMSGVGAASENRPIWLNKILHRCFIICDNRGSITSSSYERARKKHAASLKKDGSLSFRSLVGVDEFKADHPFMYIIMDSATKTILLIGLYTDPSETLEVIHENQLSTEEAHQIYTEGFYRT